MPVLFRLRPHIIQELNRISIQRIESDAGRWRDVPMRIGDSKHVPPPSEEVPRYVDEMCDYINDNWGDKSALHLAGYVMWRLNWIHPFVDGNGRTTRAVSYYVLCARLGFRIPGVKTIPELISRNKGPYYKALEAADDADAIGRIDVGVMADLLKDLLAAQMLEAVERADSVIASPRGSRHVPQDDERAPVRNEPQGQMSTNPYLLILREAIEAVPQVRWALGVVGVVSAVGLVIGGLNVHPLVAIVGFPLMLVFMVALVAFAYGVRDFALSGGTPARILIWFTLALFMVISTSIFSAAVTNWPWHFRDWIERQAHSTEPQRISSFRPTADIDCAGTGNSDKERCPWWLISLEHTLPKSSFSVSARLPLSLSSVGQDPHRAGKLFLYCGDQQIGTDETFANNSQFVSRVVLSVSGDCSIDKPTIRLEANPRGSTRMMKTVLLR